MSSNYVNIRPSETIIKLLLEITIKITMIRRTLVIVIKILTNKL